jgi:hypothetical protein
MVRMLKHGEIGLVCTLKQQNDTQLLIESSKV